MDHINEAKRYLENAREILKDKAQKKDGYFHDKKYVKMAGHTAYSGVLVALDGLFKIRGIETKGRKSSEWYQLQLAGIDKKILSCFASAYDTLHLALGYDGNPNVKVANAG